MDTCYTMQQSWDEQTETQRHDMTHLKPLQHLSGTARTQESQSPPKQSYLYSDWIWKENLASRNFSSSQVHREISIACGVTEDICCCSWQRHNVLGREKEGSCEDRVETSLFLSGRVDISLVLNGSWLLPYLKIWQFVLLSNGEEQPLFSEEQTLKSTILQYFGLKILVCVEKNGQGN